MATLRAIHHKGPLGTSYGNQKATQHLCPKGKEGGVPLLALVSPGPPSAPIGPSEPLFSIPTVTALTQEAGSMMGSLEAPALVLKKNLTLSFQAHDYPHTQT